MGRLVAAYRWICGTWLTALLLFGAGFGSAQTRQTPMAQSSHNPHGPLSIACENCHTTTSWRPIRAKAEFDHNSETKFPLRGLHEGVSCNQCHVSKVFTKVG